MAFRPRIPHVSNSIVLCACVSCGGGGPGTERGHVGSCALPLRLVRWDMGLYTVERARSFKLHFNTVPRSRSSPGGARRAQSGQCHDPLCDVCEQKIY